MPDLKISQLPVASATTGAELFPVVQGGVTKQIALNAVRHIGSAVFDANGSMAVDTNTLFVDAVNNRVGVGDTTPGEKLDVIQDVNASLNMRVRNVNAGSSAYAMIGVNASGNSWGMRMGSSAANNNALQWVVDAFSSPVVKMTLDTSGNLGLGVVPVASDLRMLQINAASTLTAASNEINIAQNATYAVGAWRYIDTTAVSLYKQVNGTHSWSTAPSGTAGNAISFTQAMTLDASGNLLVGLTSAAAKLDVISTGTDLTLRVRSANNNEVVRVESTGTALSLLRFINTSNNAVYAGSSSGAFVVATTSVDRLQVKVNGQTRFVPLSADPSGAETGDVYYNSSTNKLRVYNGAWVDLH